MKKISLIVFALAVCALAVSTSARADRTVQVMLQEVPTSGPMPDSTTPVTIEVKMDPKMMATMSTFLTNGSMTLTCMPGGPTIMMCHGK